MTKGRHDNCENWDYATHPQVDTLRIRSEELIESINQDPKSARNYGFDTRPVHKLLFTGLTPKKCPNLAGNYRGYPGCKYLRRYRVTLGPTEPLVGLPYPPEVVESTMRGLEARLMQLEAEFEAWRSDPDPKPEPQQVLSRLVETVCIALESFLTIHPYANGNGHCGRFLAWITFARQGYLPLGLPLDERPPYDEALYAHRRGNRTWLQLVMLQALTRGATTARVAHMPAHAPRPAPEPAATPQPTGLSTPLPSGGGKT